MATDMDPGYSEWSRDELFDRNDSQADSVSQLLDHGSISFGRFAVESLSWEKWSVFSHNKCQEELEKFKAPGLVAQKKAYFEEYYKRIRTLKALQEDQKAVLPLDSVSNASIPSDNLSPGTDCTPIGEEQNNAVSSPRCFAQPVDVVNGLGSHIATSDQNGIEVQVTTEQEANSLGVSQIQNSLDLSASYPDSLRTSFEVGVEKVILEHKKGEKDIEKHKPGEIHDDEEIKRVEECSLTIVGSWTAASETASQSPAALHRDLEVTQEKTVAPRRTDLNSKKCKNPASRAKNASAPSRNSGSLKHKSIRKEAAASNTDNWNLDPRTKVVAVKPPQRSKGPLCKATGKLENSIPSRNVILNGFSSISKSTSISSYTSLAAVRLSTTVPRPFAFATERRTVPRADVIDGLPEPGHACSKVSQRLTRLPVHVKGMQSMQNTSKEISVTGSLRDTALGNRRVREEIVRKTVELGTRHAMSVGRDAGDNGSRPILSKIPGQSRSNQNGVENGLRSNARTEKRKEANIQKEGSSSVNHDEKNKDLGKRKEKERSVTKESRTTPKFSPSPLPGFYKNQTSKPESKKDLPVRSLNISLKGRKTR